MSYSEFDDVYSEPEDAMQENELVWQHVDLCRAYRDRSREQMMRTLDERRALSDLYPRRVDSPVTNLGTGQVKASRFPVESGVDRAAPSRAQNVSTPAPLHTVGGMTPTEEKEEDSA